MNGAEHEYSHSQPHSELWVSGNKYLFRLNESYADLFVAAFAPALWEGHYPRFVHWTNDLAAVRRITLGDPVSATPQPEPHTHAAGPLSSDSVAAFAASSVDAPKRRDIRTSRTI